MKFTMVIVMTRNYKNVAVKRFKNVINYVIYSFTLKIIVKSKLGADA